MRPVRRPTLLVLLSLVAVLALPGVVRAADGPAPPETCVPGTVWEDPVSGVKYVCIYDELYGGSRWDILPSTVQRAAGGWLYRSSAQGCVHGLTGLTGLSGSGAAVIVRSYRWPCRQTVDKSAQPAGELRTRLVLQAYGPGGWATCRDTGYRYNTATSSGWMASFDMGSVADCGVASYRAWGYGAILQGGAWRAGSQVTASLYLR